MVRPPGAALSKVIHRIGTRDRAASRLGVGALGVAGALIVHVLLVLPFLLNLSLPPRKVPNRSGVGASTLLSAAESEMTVIFVNDPARSLTADPSKLRPVASRGQQSLDLPVVVLSPDDSPAQPVWEVAADGQQAPELPAGPPDAAQHVFLYGRYLGQIQARIERAWMRPRTEIGTTTFSCRARIRQDRSGRVASVSLDACNGTDRWQQSLLSAIRTASPLPAPPDTSVYADVISLSFASQTFGEGSSTQGFEPERREGQADSAALESFRRFARGKESDEDNSGITRLTIIGSPAPPANPPLVNPDPPAPPISPTTEPFRE